MLNFINNIGTTELVVIFLIVLVLFGGKKAKELARGLGESTKEAKKVGGELKKAKNDVLSKNEEASEEDED